MADRLGEVARRTGSVVLVLHHTSKQELGRTFEDIDILAYARGGAGLMSSARVKMGLGVVENTAGQVIGLKRMSNNRPPLVPMYFRVNDGGEQVGIHYWEPISESQVKDLQAQVAGAREKAKAEGRLEDLGKDADAILEEVFSAPKKLPTRRRVCEMIATRSGTKADSASNKEKADRLIDLWETQGMVTVRREKRGDREFVTLSRLGDDGRPTIP